MRKLQVGKKHRYKVPVTKIGNRHLCILNKPVAKKHRIKVSVARIRRIKLTVAMIHRINVPIAKIHRIKLLVAKICGISYRYQIYIYLRYR